MVRGGWQGKEEGSRGGRQERVGTRDKGSRKAETRVLRLTG